ncbi:acyl-CoA carboxylase subunit epsilon [Streptomyces alkaliphilus]|uniref:Acyl-CoA carboxylase subunit epsilon n=1 Tax=Streptomyces alkaliphilus TaxID=1472722 RepID=A0A7W3T9D0_9ACTN|nr:acyl-CoA carboxylase epsilon subunit [Streptomyces alkaliphilus]MBB0242632.1 acyl-CoA carboxylase subunit epsilon [Streptomyces alkaliphilus]
MSGRRTEAEEGRVIRVLRGVPTPDELAALASVLCLLTASSATAGSARRPATAPDLTGRRFPATSWASRPHPARRWER